MFMAWVDYIHGGGLTMFNGGVDFFMGGLTIFIGQVDYVHGVG